LDSILKMLHPFMPFVTEEIYQTIDSGRSIVISEWPAVDQDHKYPESKEGMALLVDIIKSVRQTTSAVNSPLSRPIDIQIEVKEQERRAAVETKRSYIDRICNPQTPEIAQSIQVDDDAKTDVVKRARGILPLAGRVVIEDEAARLEHDIARLEGEHKRVDDKLGNEKFVSNAPRAVVDKEKEKKLGYQSQYNEVKGRLDSLKRKG